MHKSKNLSLEDLIKEAATLSQEQQIALLAVANNLKARKPIQERGA